MFIYNVTINLAEEIHNDWLNWMRNTHMPQVMKTGCFVDNKLVKVLYVEDEGHTYSAQYTFLDMQDIERYQKDFAPILQAESKKLFGDKFSAFRTLLQIM